MNHKEIQDGIQDGFQNILNAKMAIINAYGMHKMVYLFTVIHKLRLLKMCAKGYFATFKTASKMAELRFYY